MKGRLALFGFEAASGGLQLRRPVERVRQQQQEEDDGHDDGPPHELPLPLDDGEHGAAALFTPLRLR